MTSTSPSSSTSAADPRPAAISKCVPVAPTAKDSDALAAAVGTSNVSYNNSGLLCAIDNYPANGVQNCGQSVGTGKYDYWSYWHGTSGSWVYANGGPAEQPVASPADDVEGWRFQSNEPDNPNSPLPDAAGGVRPDLQRGDRGAAVIRRRQPPRRRLHRCPRRRPGPRPDLIRLPRPLSPSTGAKSTAPGAGVSARRRPPPRRRRRQQRAHHGLRRLGCKASTGGGSHHAEASSAAPSAFRRIRQPASPRPRRPLLVVAALGGAAIFRWRRRPADE